MIRYTNIVKNDNTIFRDLKSKKRLGQRPNLFLLENKMGGLKDHPFYF